MNPVAWISATVALVGGIGCATFDGRDAAATSPPPTTVATEEPGVLPVGQLMDVRLQDSLSSETAQVEQQFEATTIVDLDQDGRVLVPAGSVLRGVVTSVSPAGRLDRSGSLTLAFHELEIGGREYDIRAMPTRAFESRGVLEEGEVGAAGAAGAVLGGIIGGLEGAVIGAAVGAGGVMAATEGEDLDLPAGTIVRIRIDQPVRVAGDD